jgi:hypothetical protein
MVFLDTGNHNRIDINSAGIAITNGLKADGTAAANANQVVILANALQLIYGGVAQVTINPSGITVSNGGSASVVITPSSVAITNGSLTAPLISGGSITGTSLNVTTTGGTVNISNSTSGVEVSSGGGSNITHLGSTVISIYSGAIGSELSPTTLLVGRGGTAPTILTIGLNANDGSMHIGSKTVIDSNQIYRQGVQCVDHVIGLDFGIAGVGFGVGTVATPRTFTTADGRTATVIGGIITALTP